MKIYSTFLHLSFDKTEIKSYSIYLHNLIKLIYIKYSLETCLWSIYLL